MLRNISASDETVTTESITPREYIKRVFELTRNFELSIEAQVTNDKANSTLMDAYFDAKQQLDEAKTNCTLDELPALEAFYKAVSADILEDIKWEGMFHACDLKDCKSIKWVDPEKQVE